MGRLAGLVGVWALVGAAGCGDNIHPDITVDQSAITLPVGSSAEVTVDTGGFISKDVAPSYTVDDANVAQVWMSDDGIMVKGLAIGMTVAHASYYDDVDDISITITPAVLSTLAVQPMHLALPAGQLGSFKAVAIFTDGTEHDVTADAQWASDDSSIASLAHGAVSAVTGGNTEVHATYSGATGDASVVVSSALMTALEIAPSTIALPIGTQQQLHATAVYSDKTTHDVTAQATWSSDAPLATVSGGMVTAASGGETDIHAKFGALSAVAHVDVNTSTMVAITVDPPIAIVPIGATQTAVATAHFADGSTHDVTQQAQWASSTSHATVDHGAIVGVSVGLSDVSAAIGQLVGHSAVTVTNAQLVKIELSETVVAMPVGTTHALFATGIYSDNSTRDITATSLWTSSAPLTAAPLLGVVTALIPGDATVTASQSGLSASATVHVSAATIASLEVTPATLSVPAGTTGQLTAIGHYSDGTSQDVTSQVLWTTDNLLVAPVSNALSHGIVTGLIPGTAHVSATLGSQTGSSTVTVTSATLTSVGCDPATTTIAVGGQAALHATAVYSDGTTKDVTASASWSSSVLGIVGVSVNGVVSGLTAGTTTVNVHVGLAVAQCTVTVTAATLQSITIDAPQTLPALSTAQLVATGHYSDGSSLDLTNQVLWVGDLHVGVSNVLSHGMATGLLAGTGTVTATLNGQSATATINVTAATIARLELSDAVLVLAKGAQHQITATAVYSDGSTQDVTMSAAWSVNNGNATAVRGLAVGVQAGAAIVTATSGTTSASAVLTVTAASVTSLDVAPGAMSLPLGTTGQLTATAHYSDGTSADVTAQALWTTDAPLVAVVSNALSHGVVTALLAGSAHISATLNGVSASATITTTSALLTGVEVTPAILSVARGTTAAMHATALYSDGTSRDVTATASWSSSLPLFATVSSAGVVTGVGVGVSTITAQVGTAFATSVVTVTAAQLATLSIDVSQLTIPLGVTQQLVATGHYTDGSAQDLTQQVTWSGDAHLSISNALLARGRATGVSVGTANISAALGSVVATATATVTAATLSRIDLSDGLLTLPLGILRQLTATGVYSDGTTVDITNSCTWSATGIAVVVKGLVSALSVGAGTITCTKDGISATVSLTVSAAAVTSIDVAPATVSLPLGQNAQLTATGHFSDGTTQDLTAIAVWTTDAPLSAIVSNALTHGVVTALLGGTAHITASYGGASASATVNVSAAVLTQLQIAPGALSLPRGMTGQLTATGVYSDGSTVDLSSQVAWTALGGATVSAHGLVTATAVGTAIITAQMGAALATATVTVTAATLQSIAVGPSAVSIPRGLASQLVAMGTYSDGSVTDVSSSATWMSSAPATASVVKGKVTANAAGGATISASIGAATSSASVTVTAAVLQSISASPLALSLARGTTGAIVVTGSYSDGTTADVTATASIVSQAPATASVSGATVTANAVGITTLSVSVGTATTSVVVTVTPAQLLSLAISGGGINLPKGLTYPIVVLGSYSDGTSVDLSSTASFTSDNVSVASVSNVAGSIGLVRALAVGSATITARVGTLTATVAVNVSGSILQGITVDVGVGSLLVAEIRVFHATGTYSDGTTQDLSKQVAWASSAPTVLSVSNLAGLQGTAIALLGGTASVSATLNTITGNASASVVAGACHPVINEVATGTLLNGVDEYIELYNPCNATFDLTGDTLNYRTPLGVIDTVIVNLSGSIGAGQYLLFANTGYVGVKDGGFTFDLPSLGGGIGLRSTSGVIDSVGYGISTSSYVEGTPVLGAILGWTFARTPNGQDTNNNGIDFAAASRTPRAAN